MDRSSPREAGQARAAAGASGGPAEMGNALELMRVGATLAVVLYHAALTYVATPMRLTLWVAFEPVGSRAFDVFAYWVNGFAMPVFFLAAGVSAPAACESRGARTFLVSRVKRLLRPLLFGCLTILPLFYLLWGYGLLVTGRSDVDSILSWRFGPQVRADLYGLGHLWFLEYLFVVCCLWCGTWWLKTRLRGLPAKGATAVPLATRLVMAPWSPFLLAGATAAIFLIDSDTMLRVDNKIVPNVFRVVHYWLFFAVGGWMAKVREPRRQFARFGPLLFALAFVVFVAMTPLLLRHAAAPLDGRDRVVFCLLAALFPWLFCFGSLGVLLRWNPEKGPVVRSLSDSAFWVYLIHVPIVALIQLALLGLNWPVAVKFAVVSTLALAASLASYGPCVRHSVLGLIINGARKRLPKTARLHPEFGWVAASAAVLVLMGCALWSARVFFLERNLFAVEGGLYRSARLKAGELDAIIGRERVRSVVTFTGDGQRHPWFGDQKRVCQTRHIPIAALTLRGGVAPSRPSLNALLDLLERSPRPVLVQGYRGLDEVAFAAASARLLEGASPSEALRQFGMKYGQFGGAEVSALGRVVLDYRDWLGAQGVPHTPERFRNWAREVYAGTPRAGEDAARIASGAGNAATR